MFHTFSGCDTVSFFNGKGKKSLWKTWNVYPEITTTFINLLSESSSLINELPKFERFVILTYDKTSSQTAVNRCRLRLFANKNRQIDNIPPTKSALQEHLKRSVFQARIWKQMFSLNITYHDPTQFGWCKNETNLTPLWSHLPAVANSCRELIKCNCMKGCKTNKCNCHKEDLKCSRLRGCAGKCSI